MLQAFRYAGFAEIPPDQRQVVHQMVQAFVDVRMKVALRLLMHSKEFLRAHEVYARLIANSALTADEIGSYRGSLPSRAALQALAETFHSITRVRSLVIFQTADPAAIQQLMAEVDNSVPIGNFDDTPPEEIADKECYFVLCGNENQRTRLVDAGFPPGQVWAEGELLRQFNL
jgi:hypothetical protein